MSNVTSPAAIARIIKNEIGFPTVPWGNYGVSVTKGAVKGTAFVEANYSSESSAIRRLADIAEGLRKHGYEVRVGDSGLAATVSK